MRLSTTKDAESEMVGGRGFVGNAAAVRRVEASLARRLAVDSCYGLPANAGDTCVHTGHEYT